MRATIPLSPTFPDVCPPTPSRRTPQLFADPSQTAAGGFFTLDEASIFDVPGVCEGGDGKWMEACRTKFVGGDGKPLPPPPEGHSGLTLT